MRQRQRSRPPIDERARRVLRLGNCRRPRRRGSSPCHRRLLGAHAPRLRLSIVSEQAPTRHCPLKIEEPPNLALTTRCVRFAIPNMNLTTLALPDFSERSTSTFASSADDSAASPTAITWSTISFSRRSPKGGALSSILTSPGSQCCRLGARGYRCVGVASRDFGRCVSALLCKCVIEDPSGAAEVPCDLRLGTPAATSWRAVSTWSWLSRRARPR